MATLEEEFSILIKKSLTEYFENLNGEPPAATFYDDVVQLVEKPLIEEMLIKVDYNQKKAADLLGINRNTLSKKIKEFDIHLMKKNGTY